MKKICLILPSLKAGGMERIMVVLSKYLSNIKGIEVHLILLGENTEFFPVPLLVKVYEPNFKLQKVKFIYTFKVFFYLRKLLKKIKPYSLLSFGETYNSFVLLASLSLPIKKYISDRSEPDKDWGAFHNNLRKLLYRFADGIISQTSASKDFIKTQISGASITIIPNPTNINGNYPKNFSREKVILNVGRLIKSKRIDLLIRYFKEINPNDWKLWLVGDGPVKLELESLVKENNLQESIVFWGKRKDVEIFYERSSIFAFTSESEGFPNALLEAMSHGLPVISFDCNAGPKDLIINNENGFLINLKDDDEYLNKLKLLIYDPILRAKFGENSKKISANFDVSIIGKKYLEVLLK